MSENCIVNSCEVFVHSANFFQLTDAVSAVVLQLRFFRRYLERRTSAAQASYREMIVNAQNSLRVVKTFDVGTRFGVVFRSLYVLEHMHVLGNIFEPVVAFPIYLSLIHI